MSLFANVVSVARSMERTPSEVTMPSGRRHDAHIVDIAPMSCKYSFIFQAHSKFASVRATSDVASLPLVE